MAVAKAAPNIPKSKYLIKRISNAILTKAGIIMATIANLALPSARITLLPIMQSAKNGTLIIMGIKNSLAGSTIAPLAPKSISISLLKKRPNSTKTDANKKVIII